MVILHLTINPIWHLSVETGHWGPYSAHSSTFIHSISAKVKVLQQN